jgi:hypothetical protein
MGLATPYIKKQEKDILGQDQKHPKPMRHLVIFWRRSRAGREAHSQKDDGHVFFWVGRVSIPGLQARSGSERGEGAA